MEEKVYVVTLYNHEDLEQFYDEMAANNFRLNMKREMSRNTHYWMTEEQAEQLRQDPRVWGVAAVDSFVAKPQAIVNNTPYTKSGNFWKDDTIAPATISTNDFQWGHLHCTGTQAQRRKGTWGSGSTNETVFDTTTIFNDGKHVDVVIVDDPVSYDCAEWISPSTNQTRFVQYQWFNELNSIVNSIDDDGQTEPTGTITYPQNSSNTYFHGTHVTGTACGRHYGWAREANIYNIALTAAWSSGQQVGAYLIFDYLRAFHLNKPINPVTGRRNPTISNHSYGGIISMPEQLGEPAPLVFSSLTSVYYRGVTYNSTNPGPSGWTQAGVEADFGVRFNITKYPSWNAAISADVQDAIKDGVVVIGAAGNDNLLMTIPGDTDYNNFMTVTGVGSFYYHRGAWPNTADSGAINVGNLSRYDNFRRSSSSEFGPAVTVFAPGELILSSYSNAGLSDSKYGGAPNYFYPISGTSMASPQVAGVIACLATGKDRFNQAEALGFIQKLSISSDMTFNTSGGGYTDNTCQKGSPNLYLHIENPRKLSGHLAEVRGKRNTNGMTFPRVNTYYRS